MIKIKVTWCLWLAFLFTQAGCTSQLFIERTLPAEVPVKDSQWKVLVMNRYDADLLPYKREKKIEVYADGAMHALAGVLNAIDNDLTYTLVATDTAAYTSMAVEHFFLLHRYRKYTTGIHTTFSLPSTTSTPTWSRKWNDRKTKTGILLKRHTLRYSPNPAGPSMIAQVQYWIACR